MEHGRRKTVSYSLNPHTAHDSHSVMSLQQVFETDPVRTTSLTGYIAERLREAEAACGGGLQTRFLSKADPLLMKQIQDALTGNRP